MSSIIPRSAVIVAKNAENAVILAENAVIAAKNAAKNAVIAAKNAANAADTNSLKRTSAAADSTLPFEQAAKNTEKNTERLYTGRLSTGRLPPDHDGTTNRSEHDSLTHFEAVGKTADRLKEQFTKLVERFPFINTKEPCLNNPIFLMQQEYRIDLYTDGLKVIRSGSPNTKIPENIEDATEAQMLSVLGTGLKYRFMGEIEKIGDKQLRNKLARDLNQFNPVELAILHFETSICNATGLLSNKTFKTNANSDIHSLEIIMDHAFNVNDILNKVKKYPQLFWHLGRYQNRSELTLNNDGTITMQAKRVTDLNPELAKKLRDLIEQNVDLEKNNIEISLDHIGFCSALKNDLAPQEALYEGKYLIIISVRISFNGKPSNIALIDGIPGNNAKVQWDVEAASTAGQQFRVIRAMEAPESKLSNPNGVKYIVYVEPITK